MARQGTRFGLVAGIWLLALPVMAELYRWTDENGQTHYSDRKPAAADNAETIDQSLTPINIDDSDAQALGNVFPEADRSERQQQDRRQTDARDKSCQSARRYLRAMSGRVQFLDENDKPVHVSETERKERQKEAEKAVKKYCD